MKKFVYPVILFNDEDQKVYTILFPDLDIAASGDTVEEAFLLAEDYLKSYLNFAAKMDSQIAPPTTFNDTEKLNPKRKVLLADAEIAAEIVLTEGEKEYKNFLQKYLITAED